MYKDPLTSLWWSKGTAGHTGHHYKVYKETAKGLVHQFDADLLGKIIKKHKGAIGRFIAWKDIIFKS